jgi:predicted amidophosphoribosyltransferase
MPLAKCPRCKRLFSKADVKVCTTCWPAEEEDYAKVRDVIAQEENLAAAEVAKRAKVQIDVVDRMINDGVIAAVSTGTPMNVLCGMCGAPAISLSKKLCQACLDKLNHQVAKAQSVLKAAPLQKTAFESNLSTHEVFDQKRR